MGLRNRLTRYATFLCVIIGSLSHVDAANGGLTPDSEFAVGAAFEWGEGAPKDYGAAWTWYVKAAAHGSSAALVALGVMLEDGLGVPADPGRAVVLYRQAAALGSGSAELRLGMALEWGRGVTRDEGQAATHYAQAAGKGESIGLLYASLMRLHSDRPE